MAGVGAASIINFDAVATRGQVADICGSMGESCVVSNRGHHFEGAYVFGNGNACHDD